MKTMGTICKAMTIISTMAADLPKDQHAKTYFMGTKQVNKDRKNFDVEKQQMGREDLDDRKQDLAFNKLRDEKKPDEVSAKTKIRDESRDNLSG